MVVDDAIGSCFKGVSYTGAGFAPAARRRRPARRAAGQQPAAGKIFEAKTVIFRFLIKNINFLLKSTQLELRKNTQTVTQKVDTNAQTHT